MICLISAAFCPSFGFNSPAATSMRLSKVSAWATSTFVMANPFSRFVRAGIGDAEDHAVAVVTDEQRAVFSNRQASGTAAVRLSAVHQETRDEIFDAFGAP